MKAYSLFSLLSIGLIAFSSCKKDEEVVVPPTPPGVIIGSEGLVAAGTATLADYTASTKELDNNVFQKANNYIMGNTLNSIYVDENIVFLSMSGAGEVIIVDRNTYEVVERITGLGAPRQVLRTGETKYYITDWQEQGFHVYNYATNEVLKQTLTGKGPENMLMYESLVFVTNAGDGDNDSILSIVDAKTDLVVKQLKVGYNPNSLVLDDNNQLWVLCSGIEDANPSASTPGNLVSIDLDIDSIEYKLDSIVIKNIIPDLNNQNRPVKLAINPEGNKLYWLDNTIGANLMSRSIENLNPITNTDLFINGAFYGLGVHPEDGDIYLSVPGSGLDNGDMVRYSEVAALLDTRKVGIMTGSFGF